MSNSIDLTACIPWTVALLKSVTTGLRQTKTLGDVDKLLIQGSFVVAIP